MLARHFSLYFDILVLHSDEYADFISKEGYHTFRCKSLNSAHILDAVKKFDFSWINEKDLEAVYHDQVRIIETLRPLAVLGDTSLTLKMAAEKTNVTYISLMNGYMSKYYLYTRRISRTHPAYKLVNHLSGQILDMITQKGETLAFYKVHRPFKRIRLKNKLSKEFYYPDELEGDINLICDLVDLFPQKTLPANYVVISPLYYDTATGYAQIAKKLDNNKKTIFVSMGSTGNWSKVLFLNNPYFTKYNVIAAGNGADVLDAAHIIKTAFVNVHEIFPVTDLVICHGGNGTVYQSLLYGIPLLCKTNHFEQEWNVQALEKAHAGKSLDELSKLDEYITVINEWIVKKESGLNKRYPAKIQEEANKLGRVIRKIALNITASAVPDVHLNA